MHIQLARIYDAPPGGSPYRILVDRLWPRGVSKERAALDMWAKDIAPTPELRTWFSHKAERFEEFTARYTDELAHNPQVAEFVRQIKDKSDVVLLYAAKDPRINHAVVLKNYLEHEAAHTPS